MMILEWFGFFGVLKKQLLPFDFTTIIIVLDSLSFLTQRSFFMGQNLKLIVWDVLLLWVVDV